MADHREAPLTLWTVIPPGVGDEVVFELEVAPEAFEGLSLAAQVANETAGNGFNCWIVELSEDNLVDL